MAAAPANPGTSFPAGDPRNALYFETVGKLLQHRERAIGEGQKQAEEGRANQNYREGVLGQQEPQTYAANRYRAVREGISSSGANTERRGGIATNYANRRFANQKAQSDLENRLHQRQIGAEENYNQGVAGAGTAALERARQAAEREAQAPAAKAYNPGGERTVTGPPGPGGVVPYEESSPAGHVRVGSAAGIKWSRDPAVRRLQAIRGY